MTLEKELLKQGISKTRDFKTWDNPVYAINTDSAPENTKEFLRYVRKSVETIMDDVKTECVVNDDIGVHITGKLEKEYSKAVERLRRKSRNQAERLSVESDDALIKLMGDYNQESNRGLFEEYVFNAFFGGIIGYQLTPENSIKGAITGVGLGFFL